MSKVPSSQAGPSSVPPATAPSTSESNSGNVTAGKLTILEKILGVIAAFLALVTAVVTLAPQWIPGRETSSAPPEQLSLGRSARRA
jgi:hypothetical protein